jgi:hypothetical protein
MGHLFVSVEVLLHLGHQLFSLGPSGRHSSWSAARNRPNSSVLSSGSKTCLAKTPVFNAFMELMALPRAVRGPELFRALR